MKIINLKIILFLHLSLLEIQSSWLKENFLKQKKYIFALAVPLSIPLIYFIEKKVASRSIKKNFDLPWYRKSRFFPTAFFFNFHFEEISRPDIYEEHALIKVKQIKNCFYQLRKERSSNSFTYDKDFTQSMVTNYLSQNQIDPNKNHEDNAKKIAIDKLSNYLCKKKEHISDIYISGDSENPFATIILTGSDTELLQSRQKATIDIDMHDYNEFIKATDNVLPVCVKNKMQALLNLPDKELVDGRLFDKKISFQKVKQFVDFIFSSDDQDFEKVKFIYELLQSTMLFKKTTDMDFILKFFDIFTIDEENKKKTLITELEQNNIENLKKILAMDFLYGIFPDTCNGLLRNLCSSESLIFGLKATDACDPNCPSTFLKKERFFRLGPVTLLEGLYFMLKKREKDMEEFLKKKQNGNGERKNTAQAKLAIAKELLRFFQ